jgi:hypothetical protein
MVKEKIYLLKFINNDNVVGEYISENDYTIMIRNPMLLEEIIDPESGRQMSLLSSYLPFSKSNIFEISKQHVLFISDLHPEMMRYYLNTLEIADEYVQKTIQEIKEVNETLESLLEEKQVEESLDEQPNLIQSSNNTIH